MTAGENRKVWERSYNGRFEAVRASLRSLQLESEHLHAAKASEQVQHRIRLVDAAWDAIKVPQPPPSSGGRAP